MQMTVRDILDATQGTLVAPAAENVFGCEINVCASALEAQVNDVVWDSRAVVAGSAYAALVGERVDGHRFVAQAIDAGAVLALVTHEVDEAALQAAQKANAAIIAVRDIEAALAAIAGAWRERLNAVVIGLTGSTGKTTTKNLVRDVLAAQKTVVATTGNQNNELGVPKTLLNAQASTEVVVVEMGMRGLGQLESLCAFVKPDWGLITNVGESHIELLGSRDNIARAKRELFDALPDTTGFAFINASDDYAGYLKEQARLGERSITPVFFEGFGKTDALAQQGIIKEEDALVWAKDIVFDAQGCPSFTLCAHNVPVASSPAERVSGKVSCTLQLRGAHNVSNACSAAAVGLVAGLSLEQCAAALAASQPERGRQEVLVCAGEGLLPAGVTVVDDSYNANPDSMRASLAMFSAMAVKGKRIAVLGDMGELGDFASAGHRSVGAFAARTGLALLVCVGTLARDIADEAVQAGMPADAVVHASSLEQALSTVAQSAQPDDAVLVKASHFMEFDQIVKGLVG